jgi:hypothetical protein
MHIFRHAQVDALMTLAAEKLEELADKEGFLNRNQVRIQVCVYTDTEGGRHTLSLCYVSS